MNNVVKINGDCMMLLSYMIAENTEETGHQNLVFDQRLRRLNLIVKHAFRKALDELKNKTR